MKSLICLVVALGWLPCAESEVLLTNNIYVSPLDTTYDGQDLIVSNATLTVDGPHALASLRVETGGVVTHTAVPNGFIGLTNRFADEPQMLVSTNDVTLANSNTVAGIVSVKDASGTIVYTNNTDYVATLAGGQGFVRRTDTSAIPDGALVLVTYDVATGSVAAGLTLTVTDALTVVAGGKINVSGGGYSSTFGSGHGGYAIGVGGGGGANGGNGGNGGITVSNLISPGGAAFGLYSQPTNLGGAGGALTTSVSGGAGGGTVRLTCASLTLDGVISANGINGTNTRSGGGAGGSVWITATNFTGTGSVTANGGIGEPSYGGGGAGGRIAVEWFNNTFSGTLVARGGAGMQAGGAGTIFTHALGQLGTVVLDNGGTLGGAGTPLSVTSNPDVIVQGGATMLHSPVQTVGNLIVRSNSAVLTSLTNNATVNFNIVSNLIIEATARVSVRGLGSTPNSGSGVGQVSSFVGAGAGHGGGGGNGSIGPNTNALGGTFYGTMNAPASQGSGGRTIGSYVGGMGGGIIRLNVSRNTKVDGEINADALAGMADRAGGGSGGSIWITTGGISGSGRISADGGAGGLPYGGGGAGGRIAVFFTSNDFAGVLSARGAVGAMAGGAGSIYVRSNVLSAPDLIFDNGGLSGARTVLTSESSFKRFVITGGALLTISNFTANTFGNLQVGSNSALLTASTSQTISVTSNALIETGGLISVDGLSANGNTSGSGGGGHGGAGGRGTLTSFGSTGILDNAVSPNTAGNAGGYGATVTTGFGRGGGVLSMTVGGTLQLDGRITANGTDASTNAAGGGAGGSIALTLGGFTGTGQIVADGGIGFLPNGGGGGGGRIAVTCNGQTNSFTGTFSAKGGNGYQRGGAGTVYYRSDTRKNIPDIIVDNGGLAGTNTVISASGIGSYNLEIKGGGWVSTASGASLYSLTVRSNGWFAATGNYTLSSDVTVEAGGSINVNAISSSGSGNGSTTLKGGAGHGGYGGFNNLTFGNVYGSITSPTSAGSLGGGTGSSFPPFGGLGGGALRLIVLGTTRVDGRISADGGNGDPGAGGGSGGSLWLTLNRFTGSGAISAAGGAGVPALGLGGGGGGGRIAITWNSNSFTGPITAPGGSGVFAGGAGTVYLKANNQPAATLLVDNAGLFGTNTPLSSSYALPTGWFNLTVANGASAFFGSAPNLLSNLTVAANGRIVSPSASTLSLTALGDLSVNAGGSITMDGRGSGRGVNPGAGVTLASKGAGGGYGGAGGASASGAAGGAVFGSNTQPTGLGGGGGAGANSYSSGCEGGGAIKLTVRGTLSIDGNLSANGNPGLQDDSGGGAGGSVWVMANSLAGAGVIAADGGDGELYGGGGGGGGRIALYASSTNSFTGVVSALGGDGANAGQNGSVVFTTNLLPFAISSASPSGAVASTVASTDFNFNQLVDPATVTPAGFSFSMPSNYVGPLPVLSTTVAPGSSTASLGFDPALNVPGDYTVIVSPTITDIFGTPMTAPFTNTFTLTPPMVEGFVWDTNNTGVAGVTVQTPGYLPTTTDTNGFYALGVQFGWTGAITPSFGANMFAPGSIALTNVTTQTTNQNFRMVDTIAPTVTSGVVDTNLFFNWAGLSGVNYQAYSSTNLIDWVPWGDLLPGTNAPMQMQFPVGTEGQSFYRLGASN